MITLISSQFVLIFGVGFTDFHLRLRIGEEMHYAPSLPGLPIYMIYGFPLSCVLKFCKYQNDYLECDSNNNIR